MKQSNGKWKGIIAALAVALVLCGLLLTWLLLQNHTSSGTIARVYQDNVVVREVDLSKLTGEETYRVEGADGAYNVILFTPEGVSCKEANCPDQICVKMGRVDSELLPITCLPHKVLIQIETE
ncbi:MAG: NusG domain II-containing protein [Oscillospiraceae bacterium]|nr:NusG domain II-containing protein [Oscillospiraceae bacterium]